MRSKAARSATIIMPNDAAATGHKIGLPLLYMMHEKSVFRITATPACGAHGAAN
jgi:hypothetical protein